MSTFARNVGWTRAVADKHAAFLAWGDELARICDALDSRSHDRKNLNRLLFEVHQLAQEWAYTVRVLAVTNDDVVLTTMPRHFGTLVL